LVLKQLDAGAPMNPSTPVFPEDGFSSDNEGMQEHTDLVRLFGGAPIPLALLT
jgi:hypothetical protein